MNFANNNLEAFSNLALAQFEKLFWDACQDHEWALLSNNTGDVIDSKALHSTMQDMLFSGPRETISKNISEESEPKDIEQIPVASSHREDVGEEEPVERTEPTVSQPTPSVAAKIDPKKVKGLKFKGANVDLPYMPDLIDYTKCCQGVKINGGLLSPCLTHVKEGGFCKPCKKLHDEGKADGTLADRQAVPMGQFVSKKSNKTEISFATYLAKRDSTIEEFNTFLGEEIGSNFQIPLTDEYTSIDKKKSKKASKKKGTDSDEGSDSDGESKPKRKPGRPKGSGKKSETPTESTETSVEDELFSESESSDVENGPACDTEAEKLREKRAGAVETMKKTLVEKEVMKEDDKIVNAKINTETNKVVEATIERANENDDAEDVEVNISDDEDEDDDGVVMFTEDGVQYARDEENSVFKLDDEGNPEDCVGSWDPIAKKVILVSDM